MDNDRICVQEPLRPNTSSPPPGADLSPLYPRGWRDGGKEGRREGGTEIDRSHSVDFLPRPAVLETPADIDVTRRINVSNVIFIERRRFTSGSPSSPAARVMSGINLS